MSVISVPETVYKVLMDYMAVNQRRVAQDRLGKSFEIGVGNNSVSRRNFVVFKASKGSILNRLIELNGADQWVERGSHSSLNVAFEYRDTLYEYFPEFSVNKFITTYHVLIKGLKPSDVLEKLEQAVTADYASVVPL
jgi:hypothetical protein